MSYLTATMNERTPATAVTVPGRGRLVGVDVVDGSSCVVVGCERAVKVRARSLCNTHYKRGQKAGTLEPLDRFSLLIDKSGDCWIWTGTKDKGGYGRFGGKLTHRIAWERAHGPIPAGLTIDHRCRVRACVRVAHLRPMPPSANFSDNGFRDRLCCINGHEWTEANTRIRIRLGRAHRVCRACDRKRQADSKARRQP